jgi:hypothetical protein
VPLVVSGRVVTCWAADSDAHTAVDFSSVMSKMRTLMPVSGAGHGLLPEYSGRSISVIPRFDPSGGCRTLWHGGLLARLRWRGWCCGLPAAGTHPRAVNLRLC